MYALSSFWPKFRAKYWICWNLEFLQLFSLGQEELLPREITMVIEVSKCNGSNKEFPLTISKQATYRDIFNS